MDRFGASPEAWAHFSDTLGLTADLLPVVSNPGAEISEMSKMKALGKTPSMYNRDGKAIGLVKWTNVVATEHDVTQWSAQPDYGICLQTRKVRAFDIDTSQAVEIADAITAITGPLPTRIRGERLLLGFTYNRPLTKRVVPVEHGIVEVLADGQQFVAEGTHPSGERYRWAPELPKAFPVLTKEQFDKVWEMFVTLYSTGEPRIAREKRKGGGADLAVHDGVADWLTENWEVYDVGSDGQVFIECPFAAEHTSDSGPSSTAYFPAGTGGYQQGHFVCLHAHCVGREDRAFLDATGYSLGQFDDLSGGTGASGASTAEGTALSTVRVHGLGGRADPRAPSDLPSHSSHWPPLARNQAGKIDPTADNLFHCAKQGGMIGRRIVYDAFADNLMWCDVDTFPGDEQWQRFTDADMVAVRIEMERRGFKPMSKDLLRECVHAAAHANRIDTAVEWLNRLTWDGVPRVEMFAVDCWGWKDTPYARAVGRYIWTAMAGRVLQPGVRADMAPILVGLQGIRKTSAIQAMVPFEDFYAEIKLDERDDNLSRKLRGKLVGELEELRGLNSRAIEEIKAFVSRRRESWVPKFKEFENFFWRRCVLIGSTNDDEFLADPTGERRWLPGECHFINLEKIIAERDQLWAEGASMFMLEGVHWKDAEDLAKVEHPRYKVGDTWQRAIAKWMSDAGIDGRTPIDKGFITAGEVLSGALGVGLAQQDKRQEVRVKRALKSIGLREIEHDDGDGKVWVL